jgi:hypothetical protein
MVFKRKNKESVKVLLELSKEEEKKVNEIMKRKDKEGKRDTIKYIINDY